MHHFTVPLSEIMTLIVNPEMARIDNTNQHMLAVIDDSLHIMIGDFTGIESAENLEEILKRNLP